MKIYVLTLAVLLSGCAFVDKHLYDPAASHAKVDPLFRTPECKNYNAPDGGHWLSTLWNKGSTQNISSGFFKDGCDYQKNSINVEPSSINVESSSSDHDSLYLTLCNNLEPTAVPDAKDKEQARIDQNKFIADKAKADQNQLEAALAQVEADKDQAIVVKNKTKGNLERAKQSQLKAMVSKKSAQDNQLLANISENIAKASKDRVTNAAQSLAIGCFKYLVSRSNEICETHKSHIFGNRAATNTALQVLATGAGIAGSMSGVGGAAPFLSGSAGFLTGSQAIMDKEIYLNTVTQALIIEINSNREDFLNNKLNSYNSATKLIGIGEIRQDAIDYHNKCSFYDGLASLISHAGDKKTKESHLALDRLVAQKAQLDVKKTQLNDELATITDSNVKAQKLAELKALESELKTLEVITASITAPAVADTKK